MPRMCLEVEYVGTPYHGWQRQKPGLLTVQGVLEHALSQLCAHSVQVVAAGRTDRGVHACRQIVHFDTPTARPLKAYIFGTNYFLPSEIRVHAAKWVSPAFHARFSALSREYTYHILNARVASAILHNRVLLHPPILDAQLMHEAAQLFLGEHDFSSFRSQGCQAKSPCKVVSMSEVRREGDMIYFSIRANGFLYNMVRNIVGVLLVIGEQKKPVSWVTEVLEARARTAAAVTIPPQGLYFMKALYPEYLFESF